MAGEGSISFSFRFVSTQKDLLEGHAFITRLETGLRPWIRACASALGLLFLGMSIALGPRLVREGHLLRPILWFGAGSLFTWRYLLRPLLGYLWIRLSTPPTQAVAESFTDSGVHVEAEGDGTYDRQWSKVSAIESATEGVAVLFDDGSTHWFPARLFESERERRTFIDYVKARIPDRADPTAPDRTPPDRTP